MSRGLSCTSCACRAMPRSNVMDGAHELDESEYLQLMADMEQSFLDAMMADEATFLSQMQADDARELDSLVGTPCSPVAIYVLMQL